jgi:hypothetical protein
MIQDLVATGGGCSVADARLDSRGEWFIGRIVETHSLVPKPVGGDRAGEAATNRYLGNARIDPASILAPVIARTATAAEGRRVVVAQDTTEATSLDADPRQGRRSSPAPCRGQGEPALARRAPRRRGHVQSSRPPQTRAIARCVNPVAPGRVRVRGMARQL